jgi:hypothetical protein
LSVARFLKDPLLSILRELLVDIYYYYYLLIVVVMVAAAVVMVVVVL